MDIKEMLLYSSFKHLAGISAKKEIVYWENGITNLEQLHDSMYSQETLFTEDECDPISANISDISTGELSSTIGELNKKSGRKDYYRVAYSFPEDTMFLDIETTGLSQVYHYVTVVGWMINGTYSYWMPGMNEASFVEAFKKAKLIVTFNGAKFDCPFLDLTFDGIDASKKPNIDLMYLCRSFGYLKGQKKVEKSIGFERPSILADHDGKEAIVLWYKFLFGDTQALNELLAYNFHDILGMMFILDYIFFEHIYGKTFPKVGKPPRFYSRENMKAIKLDPRIISETRNYVKENISNFDMQKLSVAEKYTIVGIDLAGVINKASKTGICTLKGQMASTMIVKENQDIIDYILRENPDLVSIDAPLSLPYGRSTVYNDDPCREEIGIMRFCERELKKRGVNVYPALIDSMQELTKRGIELSSTLRKLGYPVIECFPGAAQDVLQLPRKRTDETLLKTGLLRLGIHGDFENRKVCHDELDAITAALVGQFFIAEYYEPIGIAEENDLIIPQTHKKTPQNDIIIGITGPIATGKTTAARYLETQGYFYCRYSQVIKEMLAEKSISANRHSLQEAGWDLFSRMDQYQLNKMLENRISKSPRVVIDGLRHYEDYTYWKEHCFKRFFMIYIDSDYNICSARHKIVDSDMDYDKIVNHPVEAEVAGLKRFADIVLTNCGSIQKLKKALDITVEKISQSIESL